MIRLTNTRSEHLVEGTEDVTVIYATTAVQAGGPFGGAGVAYHRPVKVTQTRSGEMIPIRDHVMLARLVGVALFMLLMVARRAR